MVTRSDVTFASGGEEIAAWLYLPGAPVAAADDRRPPCVVMAHGFAGVKEARLDAFAERFAAAGMACLVFDYRHFGASGGEPRQLIDIGRQREDWRAALAYARSLTAVDGGRIAAWGTSFGGGHVLEIVGRDAGIAAAVLHLPLVDALATGRHEGVRATARLAWYGLRDIWGAIRGKAPLYVPAVGPPRTVAFMSTPDAQPGYFSIVGNAPRWRNAVTARTTVTMALFRPTASAKRARCPLLFVVGDADAITPTDVTLKAARRAPNAQVLTVPGGHFDAYLGAAFEQAVVAETAFLARHLGVGEVAPRGAATASAAG